MAGYGGTYLKLVEGFEWRDQLLQDPAMRAACRTRIQEMGTPGGVIACTADGIYYVGHSITNAYVELCKLVKTRGVAFQVGPISLDRLVE